MAASPQFEPYGVGKKLYGLRGSPHLGPSGPNAKLGYKERDLTARTRRDAMVRRLKSIQKGRVLNPDVLKKV